MAAGRVYPESTVTYRLSVVKKCEGMMLPGLDAVLGVVDAGCSGAMTPAWPRVAAH